MGISYHSSPADWLKTMKILAKRIKCSFRAMLLSDFGIVEHFWPHHRFSHPKISPNGLLEHQKVNFHTFLNAVNIDSVVFSPWKTILATTRAKLNFGIHVENLGKAYWQMSCILKGTWVNDMSNMTCVLKFASRRINIHDFSQQRCFNWRRWSGTRDL